MKETKLKDWVRSGSPWIWLNASAMSISMISVIGLLLLIGVRGLGHFWPSDVLQAGYIERQGKVEQIIGSIEEVETNTAAYLRQLGYTLPEGIETADRYLMKLGNRDVTGRDFRWVLAASLQDIRYPPDIVVVERREWGNQYGMLTGLKEHGQAVAGGTDLWTELQRRLARTLALHKEIDHIEKVEIGGVNYQIERLRLDKRRLEMDGVTDPQAFADITSRRGQLQGKYKKLTDRLAILNQAIKSDSYVMHTANGKDVELPLAKMVRAYRPNQMSLLEKTGYYFSKLREFIFDDPREANTEGGVFPAIFGTVLMVLIMALMVTPFGVVAAVYLHEYAHQGLLTRIIRIAVNNLAGVPSVVYGVFGLGFFVYVIGGRIDQLFFPEALPAPTFGTPGLLWSSLTLAILTVPVVIVATEEGLSRIPNAIREGSLALGATKAETLWRTVLPMASPAIMTGMILAVARAAGEVAPLMMVGVVKLAPSLPLDGNFPYLHLERKFMHLGFHIYDVGFQSPNVEAARPLVYSTSLLLVIIIVVLNLAAIRIRNNLREKYHATEH